MGYVVRYVLTDRKTGRLSYRRVYPSELRHFIPKCPRELKVSLEGKTLKDPRALRRYVAAEADYNRAVTAARLKAMGKSRPLVESDIPFLASTYAHRLRKNLSETHYEDDDSAREWLTASAWRYAPFGFMDAEGAELADRSEPWTNSQRVREVLPALITHWYALRADGDRSGIIEAEAQTAEELLAEHNLTSETDGAVFFAFCRALLASDIAAAEQLHRLASEGVEIEPVPPPSPDEMASEGQISSSGAIPADADSLGTIAEGLISNRIDPVGTHQAQAWRTALRFWREAYGEVPWTDITRRMASEWAELLSRRPSSVPHKYATKPLKELVALYADDETTRRLSPRTIRQHITSLHGIWSKAERKGIIEGKANPFAKHGISVPTKSSGKELTSAELNAMFSLPVFTKGERPAGGKGEASYWVPLFALLTGARPDLPPVGSLDLM